MEVATVGRLKLWEVGAELEALIQEIVDADGEITPELETRLAEDEMRFEDKAERVGLKARELKANAAAAQEEVERLLATHRRYANSYDRLKRYLHGQMERAEVPRIETPRITLAITRTGGRPSVAWTGEPEQIPDRYRRTVHSLDTEAFWKDVKHADEVPPGFVLQPRGDHLRIR